MVLRRLAELNPQEYGGWSFTRLGEVLAEHGLRARQHNGTTVVRTAEVAAALNRRDDADGDGDGDVYREGGGQGGP
jgi:S-DNA-T family DNA segregation ATPase FtsK/SpoIIIE